MHMKHFVVGIDVGGTNVKLGLVDDAGRVFARAGFSTKTVMQTTETLINAICEAALSLLITAGVEKQDVQGVGIGLPGLVDVKHGVVRVLPNIPGWHDVPLKSIMEARLQLPVQLENDVNLITLGEWKYGAAQGKQDVICMTLGTGVGAGLILDGRIYRGPGFAAGEIGHVPYGEDGPKCGCGGQGCYERYVGNERLHQDAARMFGNDQITLEEVYAKALEGDRQALNFWDQTGEKVAKGLIGTINILNPECVVVGGGVSRSLELMLPAIERVIHGRCMKIQAQMVKFVKASLDSDAGIIGAKVLIAYENK